MTADAPVASPWGALRDRPDRFLSSSWPWRSLTYLLTSGVSGLATLIAVVTLSVVGVVTLPFVVGFFALRRLPAVVSMARSSERSRLRTLLAGAPDAPGAAREHVTPREVSYVVLLCGVLWLVDVVVAGAAVLITGSLAIAPLLASIDTADVLGWEFSSPVEALRVTIVAVPVSLVGGAYVVTALAACQAVIAAQLLGLTDEHLHTEITNLRTSRLTLVDGFETERRRIERDIHDGIQQRLVGLTILLGRAETDIPTGPGLELITRAHHEADTALCELRETVRGIHPRVLTDHGLEAAIHDIADRMPLTTTIDISLPHRLPTTVETTTYYVISEALTNITKHAHATHTTIHARTHNNTLHATITDNGIGGATVTPHAGLHGLITRLDALDGTLTITSPTNGPTTLRMACPCTPGA